MYPSAHTLGSEKFLFLYFINALKPKRYYFLTTIVSVYSYDIS